MPIALVTALISAGGLVLGSVIGAICSWFISKFSLNEQKIIQKEKEKMCMDTEKNNDEKETKKAESEKKLKARL